MGEVQILFSLFPGFLAALTNRGAIHPYILLVFTVVVGRGCLLDAERFCNL